MFGLGLTHHIPFVVYISGWILSAYALFRNTQIPFMLLAACIPFTNMLARLTIYWEGKDFIDILFIAIFLGWIIQSIGKGKKILADTPLNKILIFHIFFTYFQLWHGSWCLKIPAPIALNDPRFQMWKNYIMLPLLYFITVNNFRDYKSLRRLVLLVLAAILIMGLYFFKDYRYISKDTYRDAKRGAGTFNYLGPNEWGAFHAHFVFLFVSLFFVDSSLKLLAIPMLLGAFSSMYSLIFSYSRGAYVAFPIGLIAFSVIRRKFIVIVLVLVLFLSWKSLVPQGVLDRIEGTQTEAGELDNSSQTRLQLWNDALSMFSKNPVWGMGFNTMPYAGLSYGYGDTHNVYIKILAEQGIVGFCVFFWILFQSFMQGWQLYRNANDKFFRGLGLGFALSVVSIMVTNFFGDRWTYLQLGAYFWILLGCVVRANMLRRDEAAKGHGQDLQPLR